MPTCFPTVISKQTKNLLLTKDHPSLNTYFVINCKSSNFVLFLQLTN